MTNIDKMNWLTNQADYVLTQRLEKQEYSEMILVIKSADLGVRLNLMTLELFHDYLTTPKAEKENNKTKLERIKEVADKTKKELKKEELKHQQREQEIMSRIQDTEEKE